MANTNSENHLTLPALEARPISHSLGQIRHVLALGGIKEITNIEEIQNSKHQKDKLYKLSDGQTILMTSRKHIPRPAKAHGVLYTGNDNQPQWSSHVALEQFDKIIVEGELKALTKEITRNWSGNFRFRAEEKNDDGTISVSGLRPPQIGGLHAIGAHWSLYRQPATVVMPTGTGKTEMMLATLSAYVRGTLLVIVPSTVLRDQTANKFLRFGLLPALGNLAPGTRNPIVGIIKRRPKSVADLDILEKCNVVIGTISALGEGSAEPLISDISKFVDVLIVDEAHHIPAQGWSEFRKHFVDRKILQFTATPFRRDGKLVDGKVIYSYPLRNAQRDRYFKPISFEPVYALDQAEADQAIAEAAVNRLRADRANGLNHLVMARCSNITRATAIHAIYQNIASDLDPVIVHSEAKDSSSSLVPRHG